MGFASHRHSIRWLPEAASEPTSTLVLTSQSGWFIDVRIIHDTTPISSSLPANEDKLMTIQSDTPILPLSELDWGFSGQATSVPATGSTPTRSSWNHWVDSKTKLHEEPIIDSGEMFPQDNGLTLETGSMPNPATGLDTAYEEVWEDLPKHQPSDLETECFILTNDEPERFTRGCIMQLGQYCQAVLRIGDEMRVERWAYCDKQWHLTAQVGEEMDAGKLLLEVHDVDNKQNLRKIEVGDDLESNGLQWRCKEIVRPKKITRSIPKGEDSK